MGRSVHSKPYKDLLALMISARERAGLTQTELADRIGQTQSFVSKCERGERRMDVVEFIEFADAMGLDPTSIFAQFILQAYGRTTGRKA
ncbi:helix-turn-helix transcriptional regulator [Methylosinus sp. Sm6]|uniref:helix-turn-helix domain-containing protein n=1 Tax=Methylosinus sp. Sm6 TaxID=2866948 RepID=UPI001C9956FF|nr:helix-turn-helix domain-containing protein [Methylosinus sp. Sm6]